MTRKRYIKLLMAEGIKRDNANAMAWKVVRDGRSYAEAYAVEADYIEKLKARAMEVLPQLTAAITEAAPAILEAAAKAVRALAAGIGAFNEAFAAEYEKSLQ